VDCDHRLLRQFGHSLASFLFLSGLVRGTCVVPGVSGRPRAPAFSLFSCRERFRGFTFALQMAGSRDTGSVIAICSSPPPFLKVRRYRGGPTPQQKNSFLCGARHSFPFHLVPPPPPLWKFNFLSLTFETLGCPLAHFWSPPMVSPHSFLCSTRERLEFAFVILIPLTKALDEGVLMPRRESL